MSISSVNFETYIIFAFDAYPSRLCQRLIYEFLLKRYIDLFFPLTSIALLILVLKNKKVFSSCY